MTRIVAISQTPIEDRLQHHSLDRARWLGADAVILGKIVVLDIKVMQGEASFTDPHTFVVASEAGSRMLTSAAILIAVGTVPTPPPGVAVDGEVVLSSDDLLQLKWLPRTMGSWAPA